VLRPELAATVGAERFLREIRIAAQLNHPHILPLLDSGTIEEQPTAVPPYRRGPVRPSARPPDRLSLLRDAVCRG
jgi:serine/threonine-protein kinase